ncbi:hypothetical protein EN780_28395 [Mesorhizobium sp. M4B.F.Ca.ET.089.01.1.1]|uniref:hypothetical protein n=1 Tax=Mesorhizobium sp. M4B.F.Ca.ET.089.01.1.1 TaxID=2496662 RepID=UPI000FE347E2|nr:hypothetical protein [Mesorhizobium sp. M4B.F.Ca.ET.089.01.1.1]RWX61825.1 hypothetical protein EN780_28395 [Mesorhizobium sp. M4B.F.Ca.ET.089.01.1.1]
MTFFTARRIAAAFFIATLAAPAAHAGDVTFEIRNGHPNAMRLELYSQDRDYVWPGNDKDFYLDDGETKQLPISCEEGESICYGAWVDGDEGTYWGVGPDNDQPCDSCCFICVEHSTETIDLAE